MSKERVPQKNEPQYIKTGPIPHKSEKTEYIEAGPIVFGVEFRFLHHIEIDPKRRVTDGIADFGVCIHVFVDGKDNSHERLRFDCFHVTPHYHYIDSANKRLETIFLDTAVCGDPFQWTMERLRTTLPAMLIKAGADQAARQLDQREIDAALPKITAWAGTLAQLAQTNWRGTMYLTGNKPQTAFQ